MESALKVGLGSTQETLLYPLQFRRQGPPQCPLQAVFSLQTQGVRYPYPKPAQQKLELPQN